MAPPKTPNPAAFTNPILPGWHPDPSWTLVPEWNNTLFLVVSSFMTFPGLPLYASTNLLDWKHVANVFNRPSQVPQLQDDEGQSNGLYAPTIRYHGGMFYVITTYVRLGGDPPETTGLVFKSANPFDEESWSRGDPIIFSSPRGILDPDLFWDDDGTLYVQAGSLAHQEIVQFPLDLATGASGPAKTLWSGTGEVAPEGPHLYKRGGFYYLVIAEGGTEMRHCVQVARSRRPWSPFVPSPHNPTLTNRGTGEEFQTVGHADLLEDVEGNWWAVALATRCGPGFGEYPMGRETVMTTVEWDAEGWPMMAPIRRVMAGWQLPTSSNGQELSSTRHIVEGDADELDFLPGSILPQHLVHWRFPPPNAFQISPSNKETPTPSLRILPSRANLTHYHSPPRPLSFISRRQTHSAFTFTIDVTFHSFSPGHEVGVTAFLTQKHHASLGLCVPDPHLRFRIQCVDDDEDMATESTDPLLDWTLGKPVRLVIEGSEEYGFRFFTAALDEDMAEGQYVLRGVCPATVLSGRSGPYSGESLPCLHWIWAREEVDVGPGTLLGVYATSNGRPTQSHAYVSRWRYRKYSSGAENDWKSQAR